ncbi:MAG TPA: SPOR domain-containing protein [Solirubrobacter sp.]|nr:SPOR domain-containing protein [Solirubrobacter sp.]
MPLYLGGGLAALAVIGVILAIVALATRNQEVAQDPNATATPAPTTSALPTTTPAPTTSAIPTTTPAPTTSAFPSVSPSPTTTPFPSATASPTTGTGSSFPGWTGSDGDYTIIIESSKTRSGAEKVAQQAQDNGETVGILNSDDYSSLNGGYYVVFSGTYATKSQAEDALDSVRDDHGDAYVRQIKS